MSEKDPLDLESTLLVIHNFADIKAYLNTGLSKEEVTNLMLFRASFILLLSEMLNSNNQVIDDCLTPLLDQIILDHDPFEDLYRTPETISLLEENSLEVQKNLASLLLPEHLHEPGIPLPTRVQNLYNHYHAILPAKNIAKEILVQLSDAQRGVGVWQHI